MSLSQEMSCWISKSLIYKMTTYFKRWKIHEHCSNSFFCPMDKKMIPSDVKWCIGKCLGVCIIFFKTTKWCLIFCFIIQLLIFWDTLNYFHFYTRTALLSSGLNVWTNDSALFLFCNNYFNNCLSNSQNAN